MIKNLKPVFIFREKIHKNVLPVIVAAQFGCTSAWFAVNAVLSNMYTNFGITQMDLPLLVSVVQLGFIAGTLTFAFLNITDRFSPSKVFFTNALLVAACSLGIIYLPHQFYVLLLLRFFTGFFLAGIYPVGMKIAADYYEKGLGKALGYLVGSLVIGTAFPYLLEALQLNFSWKGVIAVTALMSIAGGLLIFLLVPDGPFRKQSSGLDVKAFKKIFSNRKFKGAAFGYFGHMWELYTFWAFVPFILKAYNSQPSKIENINALTFLIIALGGIGCVFGGYLSIKKGSGHTAFYALLFSFLCCLFSPVILYLPAFIFIAILIFWGVMVVADSPQFSSLVAQYAPPELKGSALTLVNCIGFFITVISIQVMGLVLQFVSVQYAFLFLAIGPALGLYAMKRH